MYLKFVQTLIPEELHRKIVEIARREKKSIKEVVREALEEWVVWKSDLEGDSFLYSEPMDFGVETDSSRLEALIYGDSRR